MPPKKEHKIFDNIEKKHCPTCDDWKILTDFTKQTSSWDKLCRMCRSCMISYKKNKRETDSKYKEKDIIYNEKYKSSGRRKEVSDKRYNEKKEIIIKQCIEYNNKKYKTDPSFRIISIQRRRIAKIIQSTLKGTAYINSRIELIGCTPLELKEYIEKQFLDGMTWNNYGLKTWHIDHIKPISKHNLTDPEDIKNAFNYKNLQPLWASDNLSKSNKYNNK